MKNNTKKGFTLVELLVVIAILAILATVSVVGYTSFIERANVSNDENIAAQLNQFLVALKADHKSKYYGEDIDENNIWQVTDEILNDSGLVDLIPQAADYGYHFYFDLETGEYVVKSDDEVTVSLATRWFNALVHAEDGTYEIKPGNCFTVDGRYFLVDTSGSALATAVRGFYSFGDKTPAEALQEIVDAKAQLPASLWNLVNNTVFVTAEGNYVIDLTVNHENLFVHADATYVGNQKVDYTGAVENITEADPLVTVDTDTTFVIPEGVKLPSGSLHMVATGKVVVELDAKGWTETLKAVVDADFTKDNIIINVGGTNYIVDVEKIYLANEDGTKGEHVDNLKYNNPLNNIELELKNDVIDDKVINNGTNTGNVAGDKGFFELQLKAGATGMQPENPAISSYDVIWTVVEGGEYVTVDENGRVTFKYTETEGGLVPNIDTIKIKATATIDRDGDIVGFAGYDADNAATATFTVNVGRINSIGFDSANRQWGSEATFVHKNGGSTYDFTIPFTPVNNAGITMNTTSDYITVVSSDETVIKVNGNSVTTVAEGVATLTITIDKYIVHNVSVTVRDVSNYAIQAKHDNVKYVGNSNPLTIGDLFVIGNGKTLPEGAELRVFSGIDGDDDFMNPKRGAMPTELDEENGIYCAVDENIVKLTTDLSQTIKFEGTRSNEVALAIFHNGVRISDDVKVQIVKGKNITNTNDWVTNDSIVLLSNLKLTEARGKHYDVCAGETLYGNFFTFDITAGIGSGWYGFITLNANSTMQDLRVVGSIFERLELKGDKDYGTNAVAAQNGAKITNCYIANCRAPLSILNGTVQLDNSVIFGGRFANVEIKEGTLKITGDKVVMINQPHDDSTDDVASEVVGVGIVVWMEANSAAIDASGCKDFIQYNFVSQDKTNILPTISIEVDDHIKQVLANKLGGESLANAVISGCKLLGLIVEKDVDGDGTSEEYLNLAFSKYFSQIFTQLGSTEDKIIGYEECNQSSSRHTKHEGEEGWKENTHGKCCSKEGDEGHDHTSSCSGCSIEAIYEREFLDFIFDNGSSESINLSMVSMNFKEINFTPSNNDPTGVDSSKYVKAVYKMESLVDLHFASLTTGYKVSDGNGGYTYLNQISAKSEATANAVDKYSPWATTDYTSYGFVGESIIH